MKFTVEQVTDCLRFALQEDLGTGDITTRLTIDEQQQLRGQFIAKESGVIAGLHVARRVFQLLDKEIVFSARIEDGTFVENGTVFAAVEGRARPILSAERTALNFLQRMSGIATLTRRFVEAVKDSGAVILDTRKTAPGLRLIDKWAVQLGGGQNHRIGLFDMILIKENHISAAGGVTAAVLKATQANEQNLLVEVEVRNMDELQEALSLPVDRILLDNMTTEQLRQAVNITAGRKKLEASGNVNLETVAQIAATGVDFISVGKLTHSAKALDISLLTELL